jgi:hypothetical protein
MSKHWIASLACAVLLIPVSAGAAQLEAGKLDCDISLQGGETPTVAAPDLT